MYSARATVADENSKALAKLPESEQSYTARIDGKVTDDEKKSAAAPKQLCLKIGWVVSRAEPCGTNPCPSVISAQVLLLWNFINEGLCNGSRGIVIGFGPAPDHLPLVRFVGGQRKLIEYQKWDYYDGSGNVRGSRRQIPLDLAWVRTCGAAQRNSICSVLLY
jgi:hypothetical protein